MLGFLLEQIRPGTLSYKVRPETLGEQTFSGTGKEFGLEALLYRANQATL